MLHMLKLYQLASHCLVYQHITNITRIRTYMVHSVSLQLAQRYVHNAMRTHIPEQHKYMTASNTTDKHIGVYISNC
jgi:hypothetical protein